MKRILIQFIALLCALACRAQHSIKLSVKGGDEKQPLAGATATIPSLNKTSIADGSGVVVFQNIPQGNYTIRFSFIGYEDSELPVTVPLLDTTVLEVLMEEGAHHEEEVVVTATRISRTIANIPTRVEVISGEEIAEKANMKPGDIRMMLNETTGIQTQQTSATSFNAGIRIQGLDGRYTQILRDGYPLYSGFSGGLSILQIVPLDLKQVEVIKGSASTLYGGGAIAGLVNLVSKTPGDKRELNFLANGTSAGGLDLSGFYSEKYGKTGLTLFASRNSNRPFDPADIGLTAIPKFERYTVNPRLFIYGRNVTADAGVTVITEDRIGGSVDYIKNGGTGFFEKNKTNRFTTQTGIAFKTSEHSTVQLKNSYSRFDRIITIPGYSFDALQQSSFSELTFNRRGSVADWVLGINLLTDDLAERTATTETKRDYHFNTYGVFVQNVWTLNDRFVLESGLRGDYVNDYGFELLPRVSAMLRLSDKFTTRIGGGLGYKTPTIFTEEAERIQFKNLLPINEDRLGNERSAGANWDVNYRTTIGDVSLSFNHLFYYTRLNDPLVIVPGASGNLEYENAQGHFDTKGVETNLRFLYSDFKLFIGYTYTDANTHFSNVRKWLPLTARHRFNNVLMYELEGKLKVGLEAYHFSKQRLTDGQFGKPYWITGLMIEKLWKKVTVYINFENFTDTRQSKFDMIYTGTLTNPVFKDIYAPVEGFVMNGGVKVNLH